jgi:hypothetical protein
MNSSRIVFLALFGILMLGLSIWLGQGIATDQMQTLLIMGGVVGFLICALTGQKIWLVFIFLLSMNIPLIRGFGTQELGQFLFVGFSVVLFLMRKLKLNMQLSELEFWRFAIVAVILQVYLRNPVGLNMFGASQVGGKPYLLAALAFGAGFILSKYRVNPGEIKWTMKLHILGSLLAFPVNTWRYGLGGGPRLETVQVVGEGLEGPRATRQGSLVSLSNLLAQILASRISPLRACFHPLWAIVLLITLAAAAGSGYRNTIANVGLIFLAAIAYRGGLASTMISMVMGAMGIVSLALVNLAYPLPLNVQRALTPFPGAWDERVVRDAEGSTEWRTEMWREALFTDRWIENKVFGDGLGFSRADLEKMESLGGQAGYGAISGLSIHQESVMLNGDFHSGPVQTIRTVGYFGLLVMLIAMTRMSILTHREILRCRGTEWFPILLFFGIPIVIYPLFFTFVIGDFGQAVVFIFIQSGFLDLLRNNLPLPPYQPKVKTIARPMGWQGAPTTDTAKIATR